MPPPDPAAPPGEFGFTFDRSGYRVPAVIVSPWVEPGSVYNEEYRHTSLIATLRKVWGLGEPFTAARCRGAHVRHVFSLATPRDPETWAAISAQPVPAWTMDPEVIGQGLSSLGKGIGPALIARARGDGGAASGRTQRPGKPTFHPGSSSASSGRSPATSSRSSPQMRKTPDESRTRLTA